MATTYHNVEGTFTWAQVTPGNEAVKFDFNGMNPGDLCLDQKETKITIEMDEENLAVFSASGSRKGIKDGNKVEFVRDPSKELGEDLLGYPMVVLGEEGREVYEGRIGNGSRGRVNFCVYDSKNGKGTRLEGVRVLELVEYEPNGDDWKEDTTKELPF